MATMAERLGSPELAAFQAFIGCRKGLTPVQLARASDLPHMTARRILRRFEERGVVVDMGKVPGSKSHVYRLNAADREIVEVGRAILQYAVRSNRMGGP